MCTYGPKLWTRAHVARAWGKSTETRVPTEEPEFRLCSHQKAVSVYKRNLVPSVHVVLHLRPCICSRSSYYWRLLLYKPGLGALSHSQTVFCRLEPFSPSSELQAWCRRREKTQMLGLEWPYRGTCHTFPFLNHSSSSVCQKGPEENV